MEPAKCNDGLRESVGDVKKLGVLWTNMSLTLTILRSWDHRDRNTGIALSVTGGGRWKDCVFSLLIRTKARVTRRAFATQ